MRVIVIVRKRKVERTVSEGEFFNLSKIHQKFKKTSINIKNYTAHPHDMVQVHAKFSENTAMHDQVTVRKLNVTEGRTGGGGGVAFQYLPSLQLEA